MLSSTLANKKLQLSHETLPASATKGENHHYTREERVKLSKVEGIDYLPQNSVVYRQWLRSQPHR